MPPPQKTLQWASFAVSCIYQLIVISEKNTDQDMTDFKVYLHAIKTLCYPWLNHIQRIDCYF